MKPDRQPTRISVRPASSRLLKTSPESPGRPARAPATIPGRAPLRRPPARTILVLAAALSPACAAEAPPARDEDAPTSPTVSQFPADPAVLARMLEPEYPLADSLHRCTTLGPEPAAEPPVIARRVRHGEQFRCALRDDLVISITVVADSTDPDFVWVQALDATGPDGNV